MLKFYYAPSPNPAKVALMLEECGTDYEVVPVDTRKGEQHSPEFLALNPNAKTPALTDGDTAIFDSTAILLYLAAKFGRFGFDPASAHHGAMLSWLMFIGSGIGPYTGQFVHFRLVASEPKDYALSRYAFEAGRHWDIVEERLRDRDYLVGDQYSIVDMSLWGWARNLERAFGPEAGARYPGVARFVACINDRPAAQRAEAIPARFAFKQEMDAEAKRNLFRHA